LRKIEELKTFLATMDEAHKRLNPKLENSLEGFVLQNGREFSDEPFTDEEEELIEEFFSEVECEIKQCFYSNQIALLHHAYTGKEMLDIFQYHEGYVAATIIPILHAFTTINNKVVDVTLRNHDDYSEDMITRVRENRKRFGYLGVPFSHKPVMAKMIAVGQSFSVLDNWQDGFPVLTGRQNEWM